jgi:hypothetical protein
MSWRALCAASAVLALACGGEAGRGAASGPLQASAPTPPAAAPAPATAPAERPTARRGDRHARAAARRARTVKQADGVVTRASDRQVVIRPRGAADVTLRIDRSTTVIVDGAASRGAALRAGSAVRAAYEAPRGSRPLAIRVESVPPD